MAAGAFEGTITSFDLPKEQWSSVMPGVPAEYAAPPTLWMSQGISACIAD
jgi:hypothetical protein